MNKYKYTAIDSKGQKWGYLTEKDFRQGLEDDKKWHFMKPGDKIIENETGKVKAKW